MESESDRSQSPPPITNRPDQLISQRNLSRKVVSNYLPECFSNNCNRRMGGVSHCYRNYNVAINIIKLPQFFVPFSWSSNLQSPSPSDLGRKWFNQQSHPSDVNQSSGWRIFLWKSIAASTPWCKALNHKTYHYTSFPTVCPCNWLRSLTFLSTSITRWEETIGCVPQMSGATARARSN